MNILYAINSGSRGGAEKHTFDLIKGLYNRGHKIYVWCPEGEMSDEYVKAGAEVVNRKIRLDIDPLYIFALAKFLKEKKVDVVHAHELKAVGNALLAALFAKVKVRISHTHTPISEWQVPSFKRFINTKLFYTPFVNLFSSREIGLTTSRKNIKVQEGIKEEKIEIIPNGLDLSDFTVSELTRGEYRKEIFERHDIPRGAYVFGSLGRLSVEKGTDVLIEGFAKFLNLGSTNEKNTFLLVVGAGSELDEIRAKAKSLGIEENVRVPGEKFSDEEKVKYFSSFDSFIFPSLAEGFGIVLIEAMAMSLPTICSDLDVLQEVGGSTVIFFETGNSSNLSEKMYNIYTKRDRLENVKEDARDRVEKLYSVENFIDSYESLYFELLENRT